MSAFASDLAKMQTRFDELEVKFSFQEQLISELNSALTAESRRVSELSRQVALLRGQLENLQSGAEGGVGVEPPPPHY